MAHEKLLTFLERLQAKNHLFAYNGGEKKIYIYTHTHTHTHICICNMVSESLSFISLQTEPGLDQLNTVFLSPKEKVVTNHASLGSKADSLMMV